MKKLILIILPFIITSCVETVAVGSLGTAYLMTRAKTVKDSVSDAKIAADITSKIKLSKERKELKNLNYNVYQGRVLLTGSVADKKILDKAIAKIWDIKGVKELMNETDINEKEEKHNTAFDHLLATNIKTRLFLNEKIKSLDINVEVYDKKVFLIGNLNSDYEIRAAAQIAAKVKGVKEVTSYLRSI